MKDSTASPVRGALDFLGLRKKIRAVSEDDLFNMAFVLTLLGVVMPSIASLLLYAMLS